MFPQMLTSEIFRVNVAQTLHAWIPSFITGSLHYVPLWSDPGFEYYDIYEVQVIGIHRHYHDTDDILWDAILLIRLVCGRYFLLLMPMINSNIRDWNHIDFSRIYRTLTVYNPHYPILEALYEQGYYCNAFRYYDGCETVIVTRRVLDDYLLVPDEEHIQNTHFTNAVTLS